MRMHETKLILFDGTRRQLNQMGITPKMSLLNQVNADLEELATKQRELEKKYSAASKERKALEQKMQNITQYLGLDHEDKTQSNSQEKSTKKHTDLE